MYKRFLTYDLNNGSSEDYQDLYDLMDKYHAKQITESTYQIETSEDWQIFKTKILKVTHQGDNVKAIIRTGKSIEVRTIR